MINQHLLKRQCKVITTVWLRQFSSALNNKPEPEKLTIATSMISSTNIKIRPSWCKCAVKPTNARWLGEVHASVATWIRPGCSCNILSRRSRHFLNDAWMSRDTVEGLGTEVPGRPAFMRYSKWRSLTILLGRLLSAHHLAMWALHLYERENM